MAITQNDWRGGGELPKDNMDLSFRTFVDSARRVGKFRNGLFVEPGDSGQVWSARAVQRWVYILTDGTMKQRESVLG